MANYKIHIDPSMPSDEQIAQFKNFDELYETYEFEKLRSGRFRSLDRRYTWYLAAAAVVLLLGIPSIFYLSNTTQEIAKEMVLAATEWETPFEQGILKAENGGELIGIDQDLALIVPPNAFVDAKGTTVNGAIEIHYRFLDGPQSLFLSGYQTKMEDDNKLANLEALGTVEIHAEKNGQKLSLVPGRSIEVTFRTPGDKESASVYRLGNQKQNWHYESRDSVLSPDDLLAAIPARPKIEYVQDVEIDTMISKLNPASLRKPSVPMPPFVFTKILGNLAEEEKQKLKTAWWEYVGAPEKDPYKLGILRKKWQDIRVRPTALQGQYQILLRCKTRNGKIQRYLMPVMALTEVNSEELARRHYEDRTRSYEYKLRQRRELERMIARNLQIQTQNKEAENRYWQELRDWEREYGALSDSIAQLDAKRSFLINNLGAYTIGRELNHLQPYVRLYMVQEGGEKLPEDASVYLVNDQFKTLFRCYMNHDGSFDVPLMKEGRSKVWISTSDGEVFESQDGAYAAIFSEEQKISEIRVKRVETLGQGE